MGLCLPMFPNCGAPAEANPKVLLKTRIYLLLLCTKAKLQIAPYKIY
uniref:Uncharacterized protein n=1 Tax=Triticum urartu TaxID=4572 RepID=A0A8R7QG78_TRIUA